MLAKARLWILPRGGCLLATAVGLGGAAAGVYLQVDELIKVSLERPPNFRETFSHWLCGRHAGRRTSCRRRARRSYEREPRVKAGRCRADFRILRTLVECKSDVTTMAMTKALGQCWIYKALAGEDCMVVVPDDVHPRSEWLLAFARMGVRVYSEEAALLQFLSGELPLAAIASRSPIPCPCSFAKGVCREQAGEGECA